MRTTLRPTAQAMGQPGVDWSRYYLPADPANLLRADPGRRRPVRFASDGLDLAGHLYRPPGETPTGATPAW